MATFAKTGVWRRGYDIDAVDTFFDKAKKLYQEEELSVELEVEKIRTVAFKLVRNGYDTSEVDHALDRLEQACWQRQRAQVVSGVGSQEWLTRAYESASSLYPRLNRPRGERFRAPNKGQGYKRSEVDDLLDRLALYFDGKGDMSAGEVTNSSFTMTRKSNGYDVAVVDVYLDRASSVLQAVE